VLHVGFAETDITPKLGIGHEPSFSFNRRFLMRDGHQPHPGKANPDVVNPTGK
jgi:hypothetical protein